MAIAPAAAVNAAARDRIRRLIFAARSPYTPEC
jgi:hypothetical protein